MDVLQVFRAKGKQLAWQRLDDAHVVGRPTGEPIEADAAYAVVRLSEMYLGTTRVLWRKRSPLLHAWVRFGADQGQYTVAGPGQLQDLAERNLDRVQVLNYRLAGPIAYKGGELSLLTGLYAVPREDGAAALVGTVGALAGLLNAGAAAGTEVAKLVKSGVDSILGLGETQLLLGVDDTFSAGNPLQSGFLVGIGAPSTGVDFSQLWLESGRLKVGATAGLAEPYQRHDYFVIGVERLERRPDWSGLPGLDTYEASFAGILASGDDRDGLHVALKNAWPTFREALVTSPHLTRHDAEEIAKDVADDLLKRVEAIVSENPFETRSFADGSTERLEPQEVDFARVPMRDRRDDPAAIAVLEGGQLNHVVHGGRHTPCGDIHAVGQVGVMRQTIRVDCDVCGQPYSIEISDVVDIGSEPLLRGRLMRGTLNFALCPHCGDRALIDYPFLVLDPVAGRSILFVPEGAEGSDVSAAILRNVLAIYQADGLQAFLENPVQVGDWSQLVALLAEGAAS